MGGSKGPQTHKITALFLLSIQLSLMSTFKIFILHTLLSRVSGCTYSLILDSNVLRRTEFLLTPGSLLCWGGSLRTAALSAAARRSPFIHPFQLIHPFQIGSAVHLPPRGLPKRLPELGGGPPGRPWLGGGPPGRPTLGGTPIGLLGGTPPGGTPPGGTPIGLGLP